MDPNRRPIRRPNKLNKYVINDNNYPCKQYITISPPPQPESPKDTYSRWYLPLIIKLKPCTTEFILYPEIDETGRLHYHGILTVKDWAQLYRYAYPYIRKNIGFIDIRKSKPNRLGWLIYCMKNWAQTQELLDIKEPIYRKRISSKMTIPEPEPLKHVNNIFDFFFLKEK